MATTSLFRKWRSQSFEDLVGQEAVVRTLRNALTSGSPARAYLFCGPRGTGKTSTARIFAKALNCVNGPTAEPCNECSICRRVVDGSCMDVLEIDAASHTQVEKIREFIVDKVHFAPAEARFKVYIIDEVHKLSTSSFNALLKTLEEPPPHVVFILATTHPHELLPTILSRCQRHDFHRLTPPEIRDRLALVASEEGIGLDPGAAEILARAAEGSLRDALVQLEQVATYAGQTVSEEDVRTLLGLAGRSAMDGMVAALAATDPRRALEVLHDLVQSGRDLGRLAGELVDHLRRLLLVAVKAADADVLGVPPEDFLDLQEQASRLSPARLMGWLKAAMELQGEARDAQRARLLWEMMLIRLTVPQVELDLESLSRRLERLESALAGGGAPAATPSDPRPTPAAPPPRAPEAPPTAAPSRPTPSPPPTAAAGPPPQAAPPEAVRPQPEAPRTERAEPAPEAIRPQPEAPRTERAEPAPQAETRPVPPPARPVAPPVSDVRPTPEPPRPTASAQPADLGWGEPAPTRPPAVSQVAAPRDPDPEASPVSPPAAEVPDVPSPAPVPAPVGGGTTRTPAEAREFWQRLLTAVRDQDRRLHAVLVEARVQGWEAGELTLGFPEQYRWHHERFLESRGTVERVANGLLGEPLRIQAHLGGEQAAPPAGRDEHRVFVQRATHVFNGRVVDDPRG